MCFALQRHTYFRHRNFQKWSEIDIFYIDYILIWKCASRYNGVHFSIIWTSKSDARMKYCFLLIWKYDSCYNDVHFFDILTSESGPDLVYFIYFTLGMYKTGCIFFFFYAIVGSATVLVI